MRFNLLVEAGSSKVYAALGQQTSQTKEHALVVHAPSADSWRRMIYIERGGVIMDTRVSDSSGSLTADNYVQCQPGKHDLDFADHVTS